MPPIVILDGEIEFVLDPPKGDQVLGRQGKGTMFGEVGVLCDRERFASVRAVTPLSVMRINKDSFLRMMNDNAQFSDGRGPRACMPRRPAGGEGRQRDGPLMRPAFAARFADRALDGPTMSRTDRCRRGAAARARGSPARLGARGAPVVGHRPLRLRDDAPPQPCARRVRRRGDGGGAGPACR